MRLNKGVLYRRIINSIKFYESLKENVFFRKEKDFLKIDKTVEQLKQIKQAIRENKI